MLFLALAALAADPAERPADTWDLAAVYPSVEAWQADVAAAQTAIAGLSDCRGHLATRLVDCLARRFDTLKTVARLNTYAQNHSAADTRDATWQGRAQQAELLIVALDEATSSYSPEIIAMGAPAVEAAITKDPALAPYDSYLRATVKDAAHTLDPQGEALLAATGTVLGASERTRGQLVNAELPWPKVTLSDGRERTLTPAEYTNARAAPVRADRKLVFDTFFGALGAYDGSLGAALDGAVQGHWMLAKAHHYETSVAAAVDVDHVPAAVYQTLVTQTNKNLPTLHRYLKLRGKMLGISDLAYYDLYPPLVSMEKTFPVDQAKALTLQATQPLGPAYTQTLQSAFDARWMDVYPRPGKVAGAYMDGSAYEVHPFLLLNYTGDYESVSTLAHEWGHGMHSVLSTKAQPYAKSDYSTFLAEIASTFNEALLLQTMLKNAKDDDERLYYLGTALEGLRTTYYRQALFAEFELAIHTKVEHGEPLTGESLSATYLEIARRYYGHDQGLVRVDDTYGVEWAYVQHFFYNFYVYQYATSIAASSLLADQVLAKQKGALERYLALLEAGGSDDPYPLLLKAGVDLASPAPYDAIARRMDTIMDQMEALLAKKAKAGARKK